jgi:hypothetical protein
MDYLGPVEILDMVRVILIIQVLPGLLVMLKV